MTPLVRKLIVFLLTVALGLAAGLARPDVARADGDEGSSGDNVAVAINTKDGSSLFKFAFSIRKVAGDVVDETNAAVAYASCEQCETTAIAVQIVLVTGSPSVVTPQNVAIALNEGCTLCETFAGAYQIVLGTGGPVRFTDEGRRRIAEVTRAIRRLRKEDLSPAELDARLETLVADLKEVLRTELVPIGRDDGDADENADERDDRDDGREAAEEEPRGPPQTEQTTTQAGATGTTTTATTTAATTTTTAEPATTTDTGPPTTGPTTTTTTTTP